MNKLFNIFNDKKIHLFITNVWFNTEKFLSTNVRSTNKTHSLKQNETVLNVALFSSLIAKEKITYWNNF